MANNQNSNENLVSDGGYGISDILSVRPGQTITDAHLDRFKEIKIVKDPKTGVSGTLIMIDDTGTTSLSSDDLIVASDKTIVDDRTYNSAVIFPGAKLTVN